MILYFSGTGNTKYIAELIKDQIRDNICSINKAIKNNETFDLSNEKMLVVVMPVYAWRAPKVVINWLETCKFNKQPIYFVLTCGGDMGNAAKYLKVFCKKRALKYMGTKAILMPDNYIIMFDSPDPAESKIKVSAATQSITSVSNTILKGKAFDNIKVKFSDIIKSGIVNDMFNRFYIGGKAFKVDDSCVNCGKCKELCSLNNIRVENNKPVWGNNCTHCMACISYCPKAAIEYGKKTKGKNRYYFK